MTKSLTRAERHELATLLDQTLNFTPSTAASLDDDIIRWIDRLREEAGPVEPTSLAARALIRTDEGVVEFAREHDGAGWFALGEDWDPLPWDDFLTVWGTDIIKIITGTEA